MYGKIKKLYTCIEHVRTAHSTRRVNLSQLDCWCFFCAVPVRKPNNSIPGPRIFAFRTVFHHCECYITVVAAYSKCKMSVTDGGVFAALQSFRHAHISVFLSVSVSLPLWPSVAPRWSGVGSAEQKENSKFPLHCLVWCFMQKAVSTPSPPPQCMRTEVVTRVAR